MALRGIRHNLGESGDTPAMQVLAADIVVVATSILSGVAMVVAQQLDVLDDLARMHANRQHERAEFVADVTSTIEGMQ